jgi:hypothetical protein
MSKQLSLQPKHNHKEQHVNTRARTVAVRFSDQELETVEALARKEKLLLASFVRRHVLLAVDEMLAAKPVAASE